MRRNVVTFVAGVLFAVGLAWSGMTRPSKVTGFLDMGGAWDPSLALVMLGAIAVYATTFRASRRMVKPLLADVFTQSAARRIDLRLVLGSVVFGVGWGLAGYCPGPALASLGSGTASAAYFVVAMMAGVGFARIVDARRRPSADSAAPQGAHLS